MAQQTNVTRRGFAGALAAAGAMGALGLAGGQGRIPVLEVARADEAEAAAPAKPALPADPYADLTDIQAREIAAAKAENRRLDPIKFVTDLTKDELDALLEDEAEVAEDYVTPGGKVIPAVYVRLRNHLNRYAAGLGSIVSGDDHWDVFMNFLSEEDAEHLIAIPVTKAVTAVDYAEKCGISEAEATAILDDLADRSWVWRMRRDGQGLYQVMSAIPGYWEWHELWEDAFGTDESMLAFNIGVDTGWAYEDMPLSSLFRSAVHVQACDNAIVEGEVPPYADWNASLDRFEHFGVMPCQCRTKQVNYGNLTEEDCGRMETCVSMGEIAEYFTSIGVARELTREEAREIMAANVDDGNTIEGFCFKNGGAYCSCNAKVCLFANAYIMTGGAANSMPYISDFRLAYDTDACIKCGACMQHCPMGAIEADDEGYYRPKAYCFECGQCARVCPVGARRLVAKEKWGTFERAADVFEDNLTSARAHMALGGIVDFTGDVDEVRSKVTFRP